MQVHARAKDEQFSGGTVTWSKMGQKNIHAKKVYSHDCAKKNCSLQMLVTSPAAMGGKSTIMVGK